MDFNEELKVEFEALEAIFMDDFTDLATNPPSCMVAFSGLSFDFILKLKFQFPREYPNIVPHIELPLRLNTFDLSAKESLLNCLNEIATENIGMAMVYTLVESAKDWINDNLNQNVQDDSGQFEEEKNVDFETTERDLKDTGKMAEGKWDFVIGLVGKPSAGKSTFFNAATKCNRAKTGEHPFTTIEPNYGQAFYSVKDPAYSLGVISEPAFGKNGEDERFVPLLLKDVAGLVPGASEGRGKGNRFLNDLCDADVLIHVIDISGETDQCGVKVIGSGSESGVKEHTYDPAKDVRWLNEEIHNWIFDNIMKKWCQIKKRPERLLDMFTGYHATPNLIKHAFLKANISYSKISETLPSWDLALLRHLVSTFISIRFPMLLVLNKSDRPKSFENIERFKAEFPGHKQLAVSSKIECLLQEKRNLEELEETKILLTERFGGTNVLNALNQAVSLRQPVYAFPVSDLVTLRSHDPVSKGQSSGVMRDCVVMRPGSKVLSLYETLLHHYHLISGKFVRAEALTSTKQSRIVRKDDILNDTDCCVIKIMTTKKS